MSTKESVGDFQKNLLGVAVSGLAIAGGRVWLLVTMALRTPAGRIGLPLVVLHLTLALVGPLLAPYSATAFNTFLVEGQAAIEKAEGDPDFMAFKETGNWPDDPNKLALVQFYQFQASAVDDSGSYDMDRARANLATFIREWEWTEDQKAYVDKKREQVHQLESPSSKFLLGTDNFGRDILSRVMSGARSIIGVSVAGAALGITLGTIVGMSSGYKGGKVDEVVMRVMDGLMSFPSLLVALLVLTSLGSNQVNIVLTIGVVFTAPVSRVMRSVTLELKTLEFVQSARLRGEPPLYIIFREMLPNALPVLAVEASVRLSYAILLSSSLGFLGLGVQPPSPDWGLMISESRMYIVDAPWVVLAPSGAVASLVVGVNLLTDGIRQARDLPKREARQ